MSVSCFTWKKLWVKNKNLPSGGALGDDFGFSAKGKAPAHNHAVGIGDARSQNRLDRILVPVTRSN